MVDLWFLPQIVGPVVGSMKAFYCSVNADGMGIVLAGGGGHLTNIYCH